MFRKAQAAMEFLMTYGWALLAVLVVIGALAYLGVLDVEILLPERCTFAVPLNCDDQVVEGDKLQMVLLNGGGEGIRVRSIIAESEAFKTESSGSADNFKCIWTPVSSGGSSHTGYHLLKNGESQTFALKWSVPADTTFSLDGSANGVYQSATSTAVRNIIVGNNADTTVYHMSSQAATTGVLTITGGIGTATAPPATLLTDDTIPANCHYNDLGRRKNRYSVTVHYTLADSTLPHKITGEIFSSSPT